MTPKHEQLVARVLARLDSGRSRWIIAMAGIPGAGKSTLATRLTSAVNRVAAPDTLVALGMDGFHLRKAALRQFPNPALAFARRGAPWTFDTSGLYDRLIQLRNAAGREDVMWPGFEHEKGDPVEDAYRVPASTRVVVVEGLYLLHHADGWEAISQVFDERWFLDIPLETAMERLTERHMLAWGISRSEAEARIMANDRLNAKIVLDSSHYADCRLVVSSGSGAEDEIRCS